MLVFATFASLATIFRLQTLDSFCFWYEPMFKSPRQSCPHWKAWRIRFHPCPEKKLFITFCLRIPIFFSHNLFYAEGVNVHFVHSTDMCPLKKSRFLSKVSIELGFFLNRHPNEFPLITKNESRASLTAVFHKYPRPDTRKWIFQFLRPLDVIVARETHR